MFRTNLDYISRETIRQKYTQYSSSSNFFPLVLFPLSSLFFLFLVGHVLNVIHHLSRATKQSQIHLVVVVGLGKKLNDTDEEERQVSGCEIARER